MSDLDIQIVTDIQGLDELEESFTDGSKRAVRKFLRRVEMKAAKVLMDAARAAAPYETGRLEADIHRETLPFKDGVLTVRVGPSQDTFYGLIEELGLGHGHEGTNAHWLENSAVSVQDKVLEEYFQALNEGLGDMKK